jgi:hypothetical protein
MRSYERCVWAGLIALAALPAMGQTMTVTGQSGVGCARCSQVQRQPYMAEFKLTHVQTLADGTTITRETKEIEAVDSQGRRLNANSMLLPGNAANPEELRTTVHDPVENTQANWDSRTKTARVIKLPPQDQRQGCWVNDSGNYRINYGPLRAPDQPFSGVSGMVGTGGGGGAGFGVSGIGSTSGNVVPGTVALPDMPAGQVARTMPQKPVQEDLGTDVIEGVEVHGYRTTHTIPAGQIGNDKPIVTTDEFWSAPSLGGLRLRSVNDSPQSGRQTREVVTLNVGDPDPSVFQPPEGYKVTAEELHPVACEQQQ